MATVPQLFAHSGAKSVAPDNTLPAFQAALDMRADGIELDVQCSKDGVLVVLHDYASTLTDGHGAVDELTLEELREPGRRQPLQPRLRRRAHPYVGRSVGPSMATAACSTSRSRRTSTTAATKAKR